MAQVTLSIGGFGYTVACRDGDEAHLQGLGKILDQRATDALSSVGSASESRQLLLAGLLLADELQEAKNGAKPPAAPAFDASALETLAVRLEALASTLEADVQSV
jgi:cell division protein ZapA